MSNKTIPRQRALFADWPAWHELSSDVRQQVTHQLANMCLEIMNPHDDPDNAHNAQEPTHE